MGSSQVLFCHLTLRENRTHILIFILFHRILLSYQEEDFLRKREFAVSATVKTTCHKEK